MTQQRRTTCVGILLQGAADTRRTAHNRKEKLELPAIAPRVTHPYEFGGGINNGRPGLHPSLGPLWLSVLLPVSRQSLLASSDS